jgi:hypothetical protein
LTITEGGKKAGAFQTCGFISIGLCGVDMWHVKGNKQQLVPNLELIEWQERQVPIAFDADSYTNKNVRRNIKELATELERRGAVVTVADWDLELGKGIDDVLVNHGKDMINAIMNHKQPYADWLRNLENQFNASNASGKSHQRQKKLPSQNELARAFAEKYRERMAWNSLIKAWYQFNEESGIWEEITPETVRRLVSAHIESSIGPAFSANYVTGIMSQLKALLQVTRWDEQPGLIPLQDGVLEIATMKAFTSRPWLSAPVAAAI